MLLITRNTENSTVLAETCASLLEPESHSRFGALTSQILNPLVVAHPRIGSRLAADIHAVYRVGKIPSDVDAFEQRLANHYLIKDWCVEKYRHAVVGALLILARASYNDIRIPVAPIIGQRFAKAVYALGDYQKHAVTAMTYHSPRLGAPRIRLLDEEIRCQTGYDECSGRNLVTSAAPPTHGQVEICIAHHTAAVASPEHGVLTIHVAVAAALADFMAAVPRIPHNLTTFHTIRYDFGQPHRHDGYSAA